MKTNTDFILRDIVGEKVLVPTGIATQHFNGLITLNDVAAFIWEHIEEAAEKENLVKMIVEEYEINEATALRDVDGFLAVLQERDMVKL